MNINNDDYFDENEETYWDFMTKLVNFTINSTTIGDDNYYEKYKGVIIAYSIIVIVSVFGNTLVCYVIFRHKKLQTVTNLFITNLAISDLLMTVLNIPFNLIRLLSDNWPFGVFMCQLVPHVQVTSAYVSTLTMTCIAIDRYQVIMKPLKPRLRISHGFLIVVSIWLTSTVAALPYAVYGNVIETFTYRHLQRCRIQFPEPATEYAKWLTIITLLTQYVVPISIWSRSALGAVTQGQASSQTRSKRKTIQMLILVVLIFAICWLPLNLYFLVSDVIIEPSIHRHNSTLFFICHWWAMSSVCYNPFIYCWLNENFRKGAKRWLACILSCGIHGSGTRRVPELSLFGSRQGGDSTPRTSSLIVRPDSYKKRTDEDPEEKCKRTILNREV
ncbi:G-protein coupled receptor 83-like isoform X2 [Artemia franciscana]|uniref:G-protein coupled receptor 83-like isoform X2 n=1 Tax=Artemia franciscana TaxID=6661 RepID=UPI0032DA3067